MEFVKKIVVLAIVAGLAWFGYQKYLEQQEVRKAREVTLQKLARLRPGMTREQIEQFLGPPRRVTSGGSTREGNIQQIEKSATFTYYRGDSVMFCFDQDGKLFEVCVSETNDEYYRRRTGEKVMWQHIPPSGFIHNDMGPVQDGPVTGWQ